MSSAKRRGRFGYLSEQETPPAPVAPTENELSEEEERREPSKEGGGEERFTASAPAPEPHMSAYTPTQTFTSLPKGQGRMKQERSQLNVRIPTSLKRQASAKATLEGRDIGEIVEELLREYLGR